MYRSPKNRNPVFRLDVNGTVVTVRFSETETPDTKDRIRAYLRKVMKNVFGEKYRNAWSRYNKEAKDKTRME